MAITREVFVATEYSHNKEAEDTLLKCQGYSYDEKPDDLTKAVFTTRQLKCGSRWKSLIELIFKGYTFDKWSYTESFVARNRLEFTTIFDDETKIYKSEKMQANFCSRKMTLSDSF